MVYCRSVSTSLLDVIKLQGTSRVSARRESSVLSGFYGQPISAARSKSLSSRHCVRDVLEITGRVIFIQRPLKSPVDGATEFDDDGTLNWIKAEVRVEHAWF